MNPNKERERDAFFCRQHQEIAHGRNLRRQELSQDPSATRRKRLVQEPYALVSTDKGQVILSEPLLIDLLRTDSLETVLELCFASSMDNDSVKVVSRVEGVPLGRTLIEMHPVLTWESSEQEREPFIPQNPYFQLLPIGTRTNRRTGTTITVFRPRIARVRGNLVDDDNTVDPETANGVLERLNEDERGEYYPVSWAKRNPVLTRFESEFAFLARRNVVAFDEEALRLQVLDTRMVLRTDEHAFDLNEVMERMLTRAEFVHIFVLICDEGTLVITVQSLHGRYFRSFRGIGRVSFLGQGPHSNVFGPLRKKRIRVDWINNSQRRELVFEIKDFVRGRSPYWPHFIRISVNLPHPPERSETQVGIQMELADRDWILPIHLWNVRLFVLESRDQAIPS